MKNKLVKELERALKAEPDNLVLRLKLAAALRANGQQDEAVAMYRSVAEVYAQQGRLAQATSVCKSILEIDAAQTETLALLARLQAGRGEAASLGPTPLPPPMAPTPTPNDAQPRGTFATYVPRPGHDDDGQTMERGSGKLLVGTWEPPPPEVVAAAPVVVAAAQPAPAAAVDEDRTPSTDPRPAEAEVSLEQRMTSRRISAKPLPPEETDDTTPTDRDNGLVLARAFDRPFAAAVEALAPDGSAIEQPLAVFRELPPAALRELHRRMTIRRFTPGGIIVREGDPGDACYVIQSGTVRVFKQDPGNTGGTTIELVRLGAGSIFGEFAMLADRRRHATVQAVEACEVYEISRRLLRDLAATYAEVGPALERLYRDRLIMMLLSTAPLFRALPEEERGPLMARFIPYHADAGHEIIREGEPGGGLFLIVLGQAVVTRRSNDADRTVLLASLGEGSYFGEISLLRGSMASATVTAAGPVELGHLPPKDFYAVLSAYPILWEELRREAHRREQSNLLILSNKSGLV